MTTKTFKNTGVKPDDTFKKGLGAVCTDGRTSFSSPNGGCGSPGCNCSPGHWISIVNPRTKDGIVEGTTYNFKNRDEMDEFLRKEFVDNHSV